MIYLKSYADLLYEVLPHLERYAQVESRCTGIPEDRQYYFYELQGQIRTIHLNISSMRQHMSRIRTMTGRGDDDLKPVLKELLDLCENSCFHPLVPLDRGIYEYPKLERVRITKSSDHIRIPYTEGDDKALSERFDDIEKVLSRSLWYLERTSVGQRGIRKALNNESAAALRNALRSLRITLATQDVWGCACSTPHLFKIFLGTHRHVMQHDSLLVVDMFLSATDVKPTHWREGKAYAVLRTQKKDEDSSPFQEDTLETPKKAPLSDLCARTRNIPSKASIGMRLHNTKLYHKNPTASQIAWLNAAPNATLSDLIRDAGIVTPESRIILALLISYSVLYMTGSDWLPQGWDRDMFHFLKTEDGVPYVLRPLITSRAESILHEERLPSGEVHQQPDLLQLGIVLLEIYLKEPLRSFRTQADMYDPGTPTTDVDFFTACRIQDDLNDDWNWDVYENYQAAVGACLSLDIPSSGPDGERPEYHQYIRDEVIGPLERELLVVSGLKSDDVDQFVIDSTTKASKRDAPLTSIESVEVAISVDTIDNTVFDKETKHNDKGKKRDLLHFRADSAIESSSLFDEYPSHLALATDHDLQPSLKHQLSNRADSWLQRFDKTIYGSRCSEEFTNASVGVKIAILDSGIDPSHMDISESMDRIKYRDFVLDDHGVPSDIVGHGTHTAALLLGIAKNVELCVARITTSRIVTDSTKIGKAIMHAADVWEADIICMPFGYPRRSEAQNCIQNAIMHAYRKNIVMFAAAANCGGLDNVSYPANQEQVICVSSTDGEGNPSHFNPSHEDSRSISVLGEAVPSSWTRSGLSARKSGTSFATPIAAGIAAIIMSYLEHRKQKCCWVRERAFAASKIKSRKGILTVMQRHLTLSRNEFLFLRPWHLFEKDFNAIDELLIDTLKDV